MPGPRALTTGGFLTLTLVSVCLLGHSVVGQDRLPSGNGRISGRVRSTSSDPIAGALVTLTPDDPSGLGGSRPTTISDRDGVYAFGSLEPGRYAVSVEKEGYASERYSRGHFDVTWRSVHLERDAHATQIDLVLWRTGSISGRLFKPDGSPQNATLVSIVFDDPDTPSVSVGYREVAADAEGRYTIGDAPPGTYRVSYPLGRDGGRLVDVAEGAVLTNVDLHDVGPSEVILRGTVVDESGQPGPANLRFAYGLEHTYRAGGTVRGPDGQFTVTDSRLRPGPLTVFVSADTERGLVAGVVRIDVRFGLNEFQVITRTAGSVRGRIVLELGGQWPYQIAFVPIGFGQADDAERVVSIAPDGSFAADLLVGEYRVEMRSPPGPWKISALRRDGRGLTSVVVGEGEIVDRLEVAVARR